MNPEKLVSPEQREKYGEDVEMNVYLLRHAEKQQGKNLGDTVGPEVVLSEKGVKDAIEFGEKLREKHPEFKGIKIYHSGVDRAKTTGDLIAGEDSTYSPRERESLVLKGKITQEAFNKIVEDTKTEGGNEATMIQKLLDANEVPLDEKSMTSGEISKVVASNILRMVEMSKKLFSDSKVNIVFVSHAGVIEHFLVDLLKKERLDFIEGVLGGGLQYLEGPEISIKRRDRNSVDIQVKFRDEEFSISEDELKLLSGK
jgi:broad specificity phosphatase PhoE